MPASVPPSPALPQERIRAKRDGRALSAEAIAELVAGIGDGTLSDAQVGALAMAIFLNGMDEAETVALTAAIRDSGQTLACGLDALVMDVKSGSGAFMPTHEQSVELAEAIARVATRAGTPTTALVTDMSQPLAPCAGPDAARFGDQGSDTLGHIAAACARGECDGPDRAGPLALPNLARLGLFHAHHAATGTWAEGVTPPAEVAGAWSHAAEVSSGKDTPSGHWEIAGVPVRFEWGYFRDPDNSFPPELLEALVREAGLPGVLGNCHASGTEIIARLGEEHLATGKPIVYTSGDSVFQIAAHEEVFGLERLYALCETARRLLEPYNIGLPPFADDTSFLDPAPTGAP
ncbi:hypothetical protein [Halomonas sp.]|uniref:hypothetical protein n=1 Tax=Halomonas sp. TaxID=1486246 RepID=UPI00261B8222|nr:hypothetical protein [Halomonas sp.]